MSAGPQAALIAAVAMAALAGPALARAKADYATQCVTELKPKGRYTYAAGQSIPVLRPAEGGSQAEADALNVCIRSKAAGGETAGVMNQPIRESAGAPAAGPGEKPHYTKKRRGASVLSGGAGYHGATLEGGTGYVRASPAPAVKKRKTPRGLMDLPTGYALLPGDEQLWFSLTLAQQQRALEFLKDGSTIRSSLMPD